MISGMPRREVRGKKCYEISFHVPQISVEAEGHDVRWAIRQALRKFTSKNLIPISTLVYVHQDENGDEWRYYP